MSDLLHTLLESGRISKQHHDIYLLFGVDERGRLLLKKWVYDSLFNAPEKGRGVDYAFLDGKRSFISDLVNTVESVQNLINNGGKVSSVTTGESFDDKLARMEQLINARVK